MLWMNSSLKAYDWNMLFMETKNCFLNHSKLTTWAHQRCIRMINIKGQSSQDACPPSVSPSHFKQIPKDRNQGSSLPSASPSHFIIIKVQAYQVLSILNGLRRSKQPNFASLHIWFATSWLNSKFVCLFHVSLNSKNPCSIWCALFMYISIYFFKKKSKKKFKIFFQDFQIFPPKK